MSQFYKQVQTVTCREVHVKLSLQEDGGQQQLVIYFLSSILARAYKNDDQEQIESSPLQEKVQRTYSHVLAEKPVVPAQKRLVPILPCNREIGVIFSSNSLLKTLLTIQLAWPMSKPLQLTRNIII